MSIVKEIVTVMCEQLMDDEVPEDDITELINQLWEGLHQAQNAVAVPKDVWQLVSRIYHIRSFYLAH
jgi:hypothetical protein